MDASSGALTISGVPHAPMRAILLGALLLATLGAASADHTHFVRIQADLDVGETYSLSGGAFLPADAGDLVLSGTCTARGTLAVQRVAAPADALDPTIGGAVLACSGPIPFHVEAGPFRSGDYLVNAAFVGPGVVDVVLSPVHP